MSVCLLHWHWKAAIISLLSVEVPNIPFGNLESLIDSEYQITLFKDSGWEDHFKTAADGSFKKAWETKFVDKELSLRTDTKSMLDLVIEGKYVMYEGLRSATAFPEFQVCLVRDVGFTLTEVKYAFVLSKDSQFKDAFSRVLRKMDENGQLKRIQIRNSKSASMCDRNDKEKPMNLENVIMALSILIFGGVSSIIIFYCECIKRDCKNV